MLFEHTVLCAVLHHVCMCVCVCVRAGVALSGILAVLTASQDLKATLGSKHHYLLYCLATGAWSNARAGH